MTDWLGFTAKWERICEVCETIINIGSQIMWNKNTKEVVHKHCYSGETPKKGFKKYTCPNCSTPISGRNPKELCSICIEHHEMADK